MSNRTSLTGKEFGTWEVMGYADNRKWNCRCTYCGMEKDIASYTLLHGNIPTCKHGKDPKSIIKNGVKIGEWMVVSDNIVDSKVKCKCTCGKTKEVNIYTILSGKSTSCGCTMNKENIVDMRGQTFGSLTVKEYKGAGKWECECACGNATIKKRANLLDGRATKCEICYKNKPLDIANKRFGKLTVIKYTGKKKWICKCDCGEYTEIAGANLINNSTISCGCYLYTPSYDYLIALINKYKEESLDGLYPTIHELATLERVTYKTMYYHINKFKIQYMGILRNDGTSNKEIQLREYIQSILCGTKVENNVRGLVKNYELDIYIPSKRIAIEFNGNYWYRSTFKSKKYHQEKTMESAKVGIRLVHIYEYEWDNEDKRDRIKEYLRDMLVGTVKVYGRDTLVEKIDKDIDKDIVSEFINKYHINGSTEYSIGYVLRHKESREILSAITIGKPRFSADKPDGTYEVIRFVTKNGITVLGGLSKLMKFIGNDCKGIMECISYCDLSKFTGDGYYKAGFTTSIKDITKPGYVWADRYGKVLTRYQTNKKKLIAYGYGNEECTEEEIMENLGYYKVYNSGNLKLKYVYK